MVALAVAVAVAVAVARRPASSVRRGCPDGERGPGRRLPQPATAGLCCATWASLVGFMPGVPGPLLRRFPLAEGFRSTEHPQPKVSGRPVVLCGWCQGASGALSWAGSLDAR